MGSLKDLPVSLDRNFDPETYPSFFQIYIDDKMRWVNEEAGMYCPDYKNGHYQVQRCSKVHFTFV